MLQILSLETILLIFLVFCAIFLYRRVKKSKKFYEVIHDLVEEDIIDNYDKLAENAKNKMEDNLKKEEILKEEREKIGRKFTF